MLNFFTRFTLIISIMFLFAGKASANDSDVVNCNHAWKIVVLGSSSAYGYGASVYDSAWVGKFTAYVQRKNSQNIVYNFGIPGYTTYQNLCPTGFVPPANRPAPNSSFNITAALAIHPNAIIINMPSNDAANDYSIAEQQANFERALHLADSANIPVWVTTTQPRNNLTASQTSSQIAMRDWIYTRFGDKAVDFWTSIANGDGSIVPFYDYDYAHVNNFGHDLLYKRMVSETILDSLCGRITQTLTVRAGNDVSLSLPSNSTNLNGSGSFSSLGGNITNYNWQIVSSPVGSSPALGTPNNVTTSLTNLSEGRYAVSLTATDNSFNVKSDTVNIVVSSRILIDFGPDLTTAPDVNGNYWNTVVNTQPGIKLSNAITRGNLPTAIGLEVVNRIDGTFNPGGPGTNTGNTLGALNDYPATVTSDFSFAEASATNGQWKITGLEPTKQYSIKFWGTRSVADDRIIQIKRADQLTWQEYNATNNSIYSNGATFTFSGKTQMSFDIRTKGGSPFGYICLIDITRTSPALTYNIPPVAKANDVTVSLPNTSGTLDGTASSDDDGNVVSYHWQQSSGPTTVQIVSPNSAMTVINNLIEGLYTFELTVTDDSSATSTSNVTVNVNSRILFDFGPGTIFSPDAGGKYWNNVTNGLPGIKIANALSTGNVATGLSLQIINRIDGTFNTAGPGTNTGNTIGNVGDYPSDATTDFAFAHPTGSNGQWKIAGLDSTKQYTIKFWGTKTGVSDERIIKIKRFDEPTGIQYDARNNSDYNTAAVFVFTGKKEMTFDISVDANSAFGYISVLDIKATNPPIECIPVVTITPNQAVAICSGSSITFTSSILRGGTAPTYQWRKNGVNIPGATAPTYTTTTLINNDHISCFVTANTDCATATTATSNIFTAAVLAIVPMAGNISGPTSICSLVNSGTNAVYSIAALANATIYVWSVPVGATIVSGQGTTSISVSFNSNFGTADTISVYGGFCTNSPPRKLVITKTLPATPGAITGPTNACPFVGQATNAIYSIAPVPDATSYTWTVPTGASIVSGQGSTSIQVSYNNTFVSGNIKVTSNASCGSRAPGSVSISRLTPGTPSIITGATNACPYLGTNTQVSYSIPAVTNASSYTWTVPANVSIVSGQGTTNILVTFGSAFTSSAIKVKAVSNCYVSSDRSLNITTTTSSTPGTITGPTNACPFINAPNVATYTIRKVSNALSYIWTVPAGAAITSHPAGAGLNDTIITVSYNNNFVSGTAISVQSAGCVPSAAKTLTILRTATISTPGSISGITNPCSIVGTAATAVYTISKVTGASSYNWVLPAGATATHPAGTGVNDTTIAVTYASNFVTGSITVAAANNCATSATRAIEIKTLAPVTKPVITGPTDPCVLIGSSGATYTIKPIPNATSYTWTVPTTGATAIHPNGAGVNDTVIIVNYTAAFTTGNITVRADANCGSTSTVSLTLVRKLPSVPGNITATLITACPNRVYSYSVPAIPTNATSVTWTAPAGGSIVSGQGTTSVTISYSSAAVSSTVSAAGTNNCGNGTARNQTVSLPACVAGKQTASGIAGNTIKGEINAEEKQTGFEITVMPNPTYNEFKLIVASDDKKTPVYLRLAEISSKTIELKQGITPGKTISIGANYTKGVYLAEFIQGNRHKIIKLVKL